MKQTVVCALVLVLTVASAMAQESKAGPFASMHFLIGEWRGEGGGQPGQASTGGTTFEYDLQKRVVVRKNFAEYAATKERPASRHDDLMVIYEERGALKATYWDNEGHVIRYAVSSPSVGEVVFVSEPGPGPKFRLTYKKVSDTEHALTFEIAAPGTEKFEKYIEARGKRM